MTWTSVKGTKGLSKGLIASGQKGLEPIYYFIIFYSILLNYILLYFILKILGSFILLGP